MYFFTENSKLNMEEIWSELRNHRHLLMVSDNEYLQNQEDNGYHQLVVQVWVDVAHFEQKEIACCQEHSFSQ